MNKMNFKKVIPSLFTLILVFGIYSCDTSDEPQAGLTGDSSAALTAELSGESNFSMVEDLTFSALERGGIDGRVAIAVDSTLDCAEISFIGTLNQGTLSVDFGDEGCAGLDGKVRKGKIIISVNGYWYEVGNTTSVSLVNFSIDGVQIEGSWSITAKTFSKGELVYETKLTNGKITWPNGTIAMREATRTFTVTNSFENWLDITVSVEGIASGTTANGVNYESLITDPLIFKTLCAVSQADELPVEGVLEITSDKTGFSKIVIDFGAGSCDNTFTVTIGSFSKEMTPEDLI